MIGQPTYLLIHFLGSGIKDLKSGSNFLLNPNQNIEIARGFSTSDLLIVRLASQLLIEKATQLKLYRRGANLLFKHPHVEDQKLRMVFEEIHSEMIEGSSGWHEVIKSLVEQLTVYLLRSHMNIQRTEEIELSRVGIVDRRLRRAVEFMHDNCGRELALSEIAAAAYLSEFHFARLFKKITGITPHAYLASLRIDRARKLLAETDLSIIEIGARCGYNSQSHFTKIFRESTGFTPHAFRAAITRTLDQNPSD